MYTIEELVSVARKYFGVSGVLVEVALKAAGKKKFTLAEAQQIVKIFSQREVKK